MTFTQTRGCLKLLLVTTLIAGSLPLPSTARSQTTVHGGAEKTRHRQNTKASPQTRQFQDSGSGLLVAMTGNRELGQCPLKHTDVSVAVSGYVSRVTVKQTFTNPYKSKIEAVYTFPLSNTGAVDEMLMKTGDRVIRGTIKKREEARKIYEDAKALGKVASLLDQERPNIFTQAVANIEPGATVEITLKYIDLLPYEDGRFTFAFPTVVGPRFNPGTPAGKAGTGRDHDTNLVPDASLLTPPVTPEGTRSGHDISIKVDIDSGVPMTNLTSKLHEVSIGQEGTKRAHVELKSKVTIPNKDFILSWDVAGEALKSGYITYRDPQDKDGSGYFTLMLLPPRKITPLTVAPKEMIFLIDCSGSQSGMPLDKAKETLAYIVDHMNPRDTFQVISFNNGYDKMLPRPMVASPEMKRRALNYIRKLEARGGTFMAPAVEATCKLPAPENRLRVVTFMTDGYVGNDMEVIGIVKKLRAESRWFSFGTGHSVNRFLIDEIAREGGGEAEYVIASSKAGETGSRFYKRIASPVLTDIKLKFDGVEVKEVFPKDVSDVWAQKPLYIKGRYLKPGKGSVTLTGFQAGKPYKQTLGLSFPETDTRNSGVASVWARAKVDRLMSEDWQGAQLGKPNPELKEEIVETALKHHIMTQYTSFVAVDESSDTGKDPSSKAVVPVEMPDGVSREAVFGEARHRRSISMRGLNLGGGAPQPLLRAMPTTGAASGASTSRAFMAKRKGRISFNGPALQGATNGLIPAAEPESKKDKELDPRSKLNPALLGKRGRVMVRLTLSMPLSKVRALLEKAGLKQISAESLRASKITVTGFIDTAKLLELCKLSAVERIDPA
ncbi:MAG: VWA domain-containing protein [Cyanobacteria bacterium HKST-UBA02]|nr:VWA domain-containing protein [Cyanobacteria bacterium HKST-UBA02]